jgi:ubiquinone/menaquinone biosynthesis C-methylase UbiE
MMLKKQILDACCGSRMFWFDRAEPHTVYVDNRELEDTLCDGRKLIIKPDVVADFRCLPFADDSFSLVVFDPPHLIKGGDNAWIIKKYGRLGENWREDIEKGFSECIRVLKTYGTLVFKWNEEQLSQREILQAIGCKPLFGDRRNKTHWMVFMKFPKEEKE